jgi:hypothetical protein
MQKKGTIEYWNKGFKSEKAFRGNPIFQDSIIPLFALLESPGIYSGNDKISRVSSLLRVG